MDDSFENYKLNHPVLDLEHQILLSKINKIIDLTSSQQYVDKYIKMGIELLVNEWMCHVMTEETLMRESKFPGTEEHFGIHTQIKVAILNLSRAINTQNSDLMTTLPVLLKSTRKVLVNHILEDDSKFTAWITAQELLKKD